MPDAMNLEELLLRWEEARERGQALSPEELCRNHPELLPELRRRIQALRLLDPMLALSRDEDTPSAPVGNQGLVSTVASPTGDSVAGLQASSSPVRWPAVPGYEVLGELGHGGMGVVYLARQRSLKRLVALKMILAGAHARPDHLARFRREAEAVARLQHPNIVQIYEVNEHDGLPYFSLEHVDGGSLSRALGGQPQPGREAARLVETLARAMHYAHQRGVVHRDLKPANILLQTGFTAESAESAERKTEKEKKETEELLPGRRGVGRLVPSLSSSSALSALSAVKGIAKITDFGLAKQLEEDSGQTASGAVMGTPSYMAPEQAEGRIKDIGPLTDVYALGAILYECLTGRPPFQAATPLQTIRQVISQEPVPPSHLQPRIHRDLETICLKALAKEPARRYESALALAEDLARFQAGEAIQARREGLAGRLWRKVRRHKAAVAAAVIGLVLVGVTAGAGWLYYQESGGRKVAALTTEFEAGLDAAAWQDPAADYERLEAVLDQLEALDPDKAAADRQRLHRRHADHIREQLRQGTVPPEVLTALGRHVDLLAERDPKAAEQLRQEVKRRKTGLQPAFSLVAPFERLGQVFAPAPVRVAGDTLIAQGNVPSPLLTSQECRGDVEFVAAFPHPAWEKASRLGLMLNGGEKQGYVFVLSAGAASFAEARRAGGEFRLEILRNGVRLREQRGKAADLSAGDLRLEAHRAGDLLTFLVNQKAALEFRDPLPLPASRPGVFGLYWPAGVPVRELSAFRQALPPAPSPLERGDALYAAGRWDEALAQYREQANTARKPDERAEAVFKQGLCELERNHPQAAAQLFQEVALGDAGKRWPLLARCQLWLLAVRDNRHDEAEGHFQLIQARFSFAELAALVPEQVLHDILREYGHLGVQSLFIPPDRLVRNAERSLAVQQYLNAAAEPGSPGAFAPSNFTVAIAQLNLVGARRYAGDEERALKEARQIMERLPLLGAEDVSRLALQHAVWGLIVLKRPREALEMLDRWLYTAPGIYRGPGVHVMLVDRARLHAALGEPVKAEEDLKEFYRLAPAGRDAYTFWAGACLIEGFLKEDRGDLAGARAAWERGLWSAYPRPGGQAPQQSSLGIIFGMILGSLTGKLTDAEVREFLKPLLAGAPGERASPASVAMRTIAPPTAVFVEMWRTRRGRQWARRFAFKDLPYADSLRAPAFLAACEYLHQSALPGPLSVEQDDLLWDFIRGIFAALLDGKLTDTQMITLGLAWKTGLSLDVEKALPGLDASLHAAFAYLYGHRLLQKKKPSEAAKLFAAAVKLAAAEAPVRKLAQAELDRLRQAK